MKKNKLLLILIPTIAILLILVGMFIYLKRSSTPQKIFKTFINKAFETTEKVTFNSLKMDVELSANIESDNEDLQELNNMFENSKIKIQSETDLGKVFSHENILVTYNNENFLNAELLVQDEKIYIALRDWLNKYIEIPEENMDFSQFKDEYNKVKTIDKKLLLETFKQELINEIMKQQFLKKNVQFNIDGQDINAKEYSLALSTEQSVAFVKELFSNLKQNNNFQKSLGDYKETVIEAINNAINENTEAIYSNSINDNTTAIISIYTKGLRNNFLAFDVKMQNLDGTAEGSEIIKKDKNKYELHTYKVEDNEKTVNAIAKVDNSNSVRNGNIRSGDTKILIEIPDYRRININCSYNITYNPNIQKVDVKDATSLNDMSDEDKATLITNAQDSSSYNIISNLLGIFNIGQGTSTWAVDDVFESQISNNIYKVSYNVPEDYEMLQLGDEKTKKLYMNNNTDYIQISLEKNEEEFLNNIDTNSIISPRYITNPQVSSIQNYNINNLEYKYKTIQYESSNGSTVVVLYFTHAIDSNNSYVVKVETNGNIDLEDINKFLDISVKEQTSGNTNIISVPLMSEPLISTENI